MNLRDFVYCESRFSFWMRNILHLRDSLCGKKACPVNTICAIPYDFIGQEIAVNGVYEANGLAAIEWLCSKGVVKSPSESAFVDVGANIGVYTLTLASRFKTVLAYEPHPLVFRILSLNQEINHLENVSCFNFGLSDHAGPATLVETAGNLGGASIRENQSQGKSHDVQLVRGDIALGNLEDYPVSLIKIDVEGHEAKVIYGLERTIRKYSPVLAFEANNLETNNSIIELLREFGYKKFIALNFKIGGFPLWVQFFILSIIGVRTRLVEVDDISSRKYSLVFAIMDGELF